MATYCISDIHGRYDELMELLDKVGPASDDKVYVLGDIVDKGPKINETLKWAIEDAPPGFEFSLGNHEDMLASYLAFGYKGHPWDANANARTRSQLFHKGKRPWYHEVVHAWISGLPLHFDIDVDGERHILVHGGIRVPGSLAHDEGISELGMRDERVEVAGFGEQRSQDMIWMRQGWIDRLDDDGVTFVCGHNALGFFEADAFVDRALERAGLDQRMRAGYVDRIGSRYFIDAGIMMAGAHPDADLAMLRLEDKRAFYLRKPSELIA